MVFESASAGNGDDGAAMAFTCSWAGANAVVPRHRAINAQANVQFFTFLDSPL